MCDEDGKVFVATAHWLTIVFSSDGGPDQEQTKPIEIV